MSETLNVERGTDSQQRVVRAKECDYPLTCGETAIFKKLKSSGCMVLRHGWPDFLVIPPTGKIYGVEVKNGNDVIRPGQKEMHVALRTLGIPIVVTRDGEVEERLGAIPRPIEAKAKQDVGYMTETEAAAYLAIEPRTLRLWRVRRGVPHTKPTNKIVRYRSKDLDEWMQRSRVATISP